MKSELLEIAEHIKKEQTQKTEVDKKEEKDEKKAHELPPIQRVKEIKKKRSPKGAGEVVIGGIPVDVFDIEDMIIKVSPSDMKTVQRYDNARVIEQMRNTQRPKLASLGEMNWGLILLLVIAAIGFLMIFLFGGDIMKVLSGFFSM